MYTKDWMLTHYYEASRAPFLSLSELTDEEAARVQESLLAESEIYARRNSDGMYMVYRRTIEERMRRMFTALGGRPESDTPRYYVLGQCRSCEGWYRRPAHLTTPFSAFDPATVSFTYGDSFPTFDPTHGDASEYRQRVYDARGIAEIIEKYGWPEEVGEDAPYWLPRYVEAQVWTR